MEYRQRLTTLINRGDVIIQRASAPDIMGEITEVSELGCEIKQPGPKSDAVFLTFVAFRDIRGVTSLELDPRK